MKKTVMPQAVHASWNPEALYSKAARYVQRMSSLDGDDWEYGLWSGFALEFLARAALANVSPALLAEADKNAASLYHALGFTPIDERSAQKSITISEVFRRLTSILPGFTKEQESFGILHTGRRNAELHTGELAFDGIKASDWQPRYYQICKILLLSMGIELHEFVGDNEAEVANQLIAAAADVNAKAVKGDVEAHKKVWLAKSDEERSTLNAQASVWATKQTGHRVVCPACRSQALTGGDPVSPPVQKFSEGEIRITQEYLPSRFECIACGLKISGLSRLAVAGLGDRYKKTEVLDAGEYYAARDDYSHYEDDNNEY